MNSETTINFSSLISSFLSRLEIDVENSQITDDETQFRVTIDCRRERIISVPLEAYQQLWSLFGESIEFSYQKSRLPVFNLSKNVSQETLSQLQRDIEEDEEITLDFKIDKEKLIDIYIQEPTESTVFIVYFFESKLFSFLEQVTWRRLEQTWWQDEPTTYVVTICPQYNTTYLTPFLAIINRFDDETWKTVKDEERDVRVKARQIYELCYEQVRWQEVSINFLTPYFFIDRNTDSLKPNRISSSLIAKSMSLILLYTAERVGSLVNNQSPTLVATFSTKDATVHIPLFTSTDFQGDEFAPNVLELYKSFHWVYSKLNASDSSERLPFFQLSIVESTRGTPTKDIKYALIERSAQVRKQIEWNWKVFIQGKLDEFWKELENLEQAVDSTVDTFSQQITGMVEQLSSNALAAIGALLGSLLAALFDNNFNSHIFVVGVSIYVVYLIVFPFAYGMLQQWDKFYSTSRRFENTQKRFEEMLLKEKVEQRIGSRIKDSRFRFRIWYWVTLAAYIAVAFTVIWLITLIPVLIP